MLDSIDTIKTKQDIKNKRFSPDYPVEWSCMLFWLLPEDPCAERVWSSLEWLCKECITGTDTRRGNSQWPQTGTKALGGVVCSVYYLRRAPMSLVTFSEVWMTMIGLEMTWERSICNGKHRVNLSIALRWGCV